MDNKKCEICGTTEKLTTDHIIPKWLYKRLPYFTGISKVQIQKNIGVRNKRVLCSKHNGEKGGYIDFDHPITKEFLYPIIEDLYMEMMKHK